MRLPQIEMPRILPNGSPQMTENNIKVKFKVFITEKFMHPYGHPAARNETGPNAII